MFRLGKKRMNRTMTISKTSVLALCTATKVMRTSPLAEESGSRESETTSATPMPMSTKEKEKDACSLPLTSMERRTPAGLPFLRQNLELSTAAGILGELSLEASEALRILVGS